MIHKYKGFIPHTFNVLIEPDFIKRELNIKFKVIPYEKDYFN